MAASTLSNFVLYQDEFFAGMYETLQENTNAFNSASNGAIMLTTDLHEGQFQRESFFQYTDHIYHRTPGSVSAQTDTGPTMDDVTAPKVNKGARIGYTRDAFRKLGRTNQDVSRVLGIQLGINIQKTMLNSALNALTGVFGVAAMSSAIYSDTATAMSHQKLVRGNSKFGDAAERIRTYIMHSHSSFDLNLQQIDDNIDGLTAAMVYGATPATLGRTPVVTDNPILFAAGSGTASSADDVYHIFGLQPGAIEIKLSEVTDVEYDVDTSKHNIINRIAAELAYTVRVAGMDYTGAANPADSVLATNTNWALVANSIKNGPGVLIKTR